MPEFSGNARDSYPSTIWSIASNVTWLLGSHSLKLGSEYRLYRDNGFSAGSDSGELDYNSDWTRLSDTTPSSYGQGFAGFIMGLPTGGSIQVSDSYAEQYQIFSGYVQDNWKATPRLTVNFGLRYEYEFPATESQNRSITQFNMTTVNPLQAAASAAYSNSGSTLLPARLAVLGGPLFAGVNTQRSLWRAKNGPSGLQPRVGITYTIDNNTVVRAGYGIFNQITRFNPIQTGFSQTTGLVASQNNGQSYVASTQDPFPVSGSFTNPVQQPLGAAGGLTTGAGTSMTAMSSDFKRPYMQRWSLGVERGLGKGTILGVSYVGNRGTKLWVSRAYDSIPRQYLSTLPVCDTAVINALSKKVSNPFYGLIPGQSLGTTTTTSVSQLLRPFPEFTGLSIQENTGFYWYHSLQTEIKKRFEGGYSFGAAWTWSKNMQATSYLNETDSRPERVISDQDRAHRLVLNGIYELPIGSGKTWLSGRHEFVDKLVSGWQGQGTYQIQAGQALGFGNPIFTGNVRSISLPSEQKSIKAWFDTSHFDNNPSEQLSNNIQTFPSRLPTVHGPRANLLNLSAVKNTRLASDKLSFQLRADFINALNHTNFSNPSTTLGKAAFGTVTGTNATPRVIQISGKLRF